MQTWLGPLVAPPKQKQTDSSALAALQASLASVCEMLTERDRRLERLTAEHAAVEAQATQCQALLEERLAEEAQELAKVQEQQDEDRSRQLFELIDKNNDGRIQLDEFLGAAPAIFAPGVLTSDQQLQDLETLFRRADQANSGELNMGEFMDLISNLKGEMTAAKAAPEKAE